MPKKKKKLTLLDEGIVSEPIIKSPLNYIGGKYKLLEQLLPLFPNDIELFVDLFAGGCNVGINVNAEKVWFNDNLIFLIEMYKKFQDLELEEILEHINSRIKEYDLSLTNDTGYKNLRKLYNTKREPLDLFVLIAYSFNHQIRFNNSHEFNNPFGRKRSSYNANMKKNLINFISKLHSRKSIFTDNNFDEFDYKKLSSKDFVYCDPPYLITTGTYNDGKRGFTGWSEKEELKLLEILDALNKENIRFGLSNVIEHKGKENIILKKWLERNSVYKIHHLNQHYSNSNYHTKDRNKNSTAEVLICNY